MYKRYYDGYNSYSGGSTTSYRGEVVIPKESEDTKAVNSEAANEPIAGVSQNSAQSTVAAAKSPMEAFGGLSRLLSDIEIDDIILLGVILLVLKDSADDPLLIIILLVVFLSGLIEN